MHEGGGSPHLPRSASRCGMTHLSLPVLDLSALLLVETLRLMDTRARSSGSSSYVVVVVVETERERERDECCRQNHQLLPVSLPLSVRYSFAVATRGAEPPRGHTSRREDRGARTTIKKTRKPNCPFSRARQGRAWHQNRSNPNLT